MHDIVIMSCSEPPIKEEERLVLDPWLRHQISVLSFLSDKNRLARFAGERSRYILKFEFIRVYNYSTLSLLFPISSYHIQVFAIHPPTAPSSFSHTHDHENSGVHFVDRQFQTHLLLSCAKTYSSIFLCGMSGISLSLSRSFPSGEWVSKNEAVAVRI